MKLKTIFFILTSLLLLTNCNGKTKQPKEESLWDDTIIVNNSAQVKDTETIAEREEDNDRIYYFEDLNEMRETPIMDGVPKEYFRKNNKYKNWDASNPKQVIVEYIVEKNGTPSNVEIKKSSEVKELDDEALRLIKEAKYLPGTNHKGEPIRCGNTVIYVYFPPK